MKNRRGHVLTLDALMALMIVVSVFLMALSVQIQSHVQSSENTQFKRIHYLSEDAIEALNKKGVLDEIGGEWAAAGGDNTSARWANASALAQRYLSEIMPPQMSYKLYIDNESNTIYEHAPTPESSASAKTRSARVLTGYMPGEPTIGFVSRAYLAGMVKENTSLLAGWQRTVSSGDNANHLNMTTKFRMPMDFTPSMCNEAWLRAVSRILPNERFKVWLNDKPLCDAGLCEFSTFAEIDDLCQNLSAGENTMKFEVWDEKETYEIGKGSGTRLFASYNTTEMGFNVSNRFYADRIESSCIVKQQISLLTPGDVRNISAHIETSGVSKVQLAFVYGSEIFIIGEKSPAAGLTDYTREEIQSALEAQGIYYADIKNQVYSLNIYLDTGSPGYEEGGSTPECNYSATPRILLDASYLEVDYDPFPSGFDLYGYNDITVPLDISASGDDCNPGYKTILNGSYTLPQTAFPWTVDLWLAWVYAGNTDDITQNFYANDKILHEHPGPDDFEKYLVRFGYSTNRSDGAMISGTTNNFTIVGENDEATNDMYCLSEDLTSGTATFLFRSYVDYGDVFLYGDGCNITVTFSDDTQITIGSSNETCDTDSEDAAADALTRLMDQMDFNGDGKVDIKFTGDQLTMDSSTQTRVRSLWGPSVAKLVVWV